MAVVLNKYGGMLQALGVPGVVALAVASEHIPALHDVLCGLGLCGEKGGYIPFELIPRVRSATYYSSNISAVLSNPVANPPTFAPVELPRLLSIGDRSDRPIGSLTWWNEPATTLPPVPMTSVKNTTSSLSPLQNRSIVMVSGAALLYYVSRYTRRHPNSRLARLSKKCGPSFQTLSIAYSSYCSIEYSNNPTTMALTEAAQLLAPHLAKVPFRAIAAEFARCFGVVRDIEWQQTLVDVFRSFQVPQYPAAYVFGRTDIVPVPGCPPLDLCNLSDSHVSASIFGDEHIECRGRLECMQLQSKRLAGIRAELEKEKKQLQDKKEELAKELQDKSEKLLKMNSELAEKDKENTESVATLKGYKQALEETNKTQSEEIVQVRIKLHTSEDQVEKLQGELDAMRSAKVEAEKALGDRTMAQNSEIAGLKEQANRAMTEVKNLEWTLEKETTAHLATSKTNDEQQQEASRIQEQLQKTIKSLEQALDQSSKDKASAIQERDAAKAEIASVNAQLAGARDDAAKQADRNLQLVQTVEELTGQTSNLEGLLGEQKDQNAELSRTNQGLKVERADNESVISGLRQHVEKTQVALVKETELRRDVETNLAKAQTQLIDGKAELGRSQNSASELKSQLSKELQEEQQHSAKLAQEVADLKQALEKKDAAHHSQPPMTTSAFGASSASGYPLQTQRIPQPQPNWSGQGYFPASPSPNQMGIHSSTAPSHPFAHPHQAFQPSSFPQGTSPFYPPSWAPVQHSQPKAKKAPRWRKQVKAPKPTYYISSGFWETPDVRAANRRPGNRWSAEKLEEQWVMFNSANGLPSENRSRPSEEECRQIEEAAKATQDGAAQPGSQETTNDARLSRDQEGMDDDDEEGDEPGDDIGTANGG